ncbi:hypothetical protein ACFLYL_03070 [Chloroflexota bacterium]
MTKLIITIIVVIIVLASAAYFTGLMPFTGQPSQDTEVAETPPPAPAPVETPAPQSVPVPQPAPAPKPEPSAEPEPEPVSEPEPEPEPPPVTAKEVKFEFAVTGISGSGLSRNISTQLINTGNTDAHNAWAKVEVFSQDTRIKLGGADSLRVDIGTLKAGNLVVKDVLLDFSLMDGLKMQQNGAKFTLTVYSDEKTEILYYEYTP